MPKVRIDVIVFATPPNPVEVVKNSLNDAGWDPPVKEEKLNELCSILTYTWEAP